MAEVITGKTQTRRRPKGSGSVQERSPGKCRIRVFIGTDPLTGKPRQAQRVVEAKSVTQAQKQLEALKKELVDAGQDEITATLRTVIEEYFRHSETRGRSPKPLHEGRRIARSEEHTSELQSRQYLVCR